MKNFKKITLKNKLRIITIPQEGLSATVLVLVEAGSQYETKKINGLSHFLEHMAFKGTVSRPTALAISSELDQLGAEYNAFTSQEYTGYYAKVKSEFLSQAIDIVADLFINPVFNEKEIEKEKGVVIEELNMYEDLPMKRVAELFEELLYGDQPAGWPIGGRKEIIRCLTRQQLLNYRRRHYVASATVVVVAGSFVRKDVIKYLRKSFAQVSSAKKFGKIKTKESQKTPAVAVKYKKSDQTHLVLGCRAFNAFDKRRFALEVLNGILGGGMSSRLFQRVREQLGAAYYVRSGAKLASDHGYWAVAAGVDHSKVNLAVQAITDELKKIKEELISPQELQRAKNHLTGQMVLGLESSDEQALFYGLQEVMKRSLMTPQAVLKKIQSVTAEEVKQTAQSIFQNKNLNLAIIGPFKDERKFSKITI